MNIHAILHGSQVNGPEVRSVIWVASCALACPGCFNPNTHDFNTGREFTPERLAAEVFLHALPGTKGVTISGGEPMQQGVSVLHFCMEIALRRPDWSIGMFSGYSYDELAEGRYDLREGDYVRGSAEALKILWVQLQRRLDFIKLGRFDKSQPGSDFPLCSSRNQTLVLPTMRYKFQDFPERQVEYNIEADGFVTVTGFPVGNPNS